MEQEELAKTFTTTSYNYTPYELDLISFKEFSLPFNIDDAPSGGSVRVDTASEMKLDNGEKIRYSSSNCCFMWSSPIDKPLRIRVVWKVIHNASYHDGEAGAEYDMRSSRKSAPGSRWCQAVVDVAPYTGPDRPKMLFLHFLPDGSVQAQLGTFLSAKPFSAEQVKLHSTPLAVGQICRQEIENPFYGLPRTPHRE
ncbi:DUF3304 domain-containing protein [Massilia atriviolacea]|nr:DUF3304 domain-containing protein [Massilia atriviolacea]